HVEVAVHPNVRAFVTAERDVDGPSEAAASAAFVVDAARLGRESSVGHFREARLNPGVPVVTLGTTASTAEVWSTHVISTDSAGHRYELSASPATQTDATRLDQKFRDNLIGVGWSPSEADKFL